ncbi:hypothetical protein DS6A_53 [Mycobacterium phage DS6A]|uniref:Uncharacterized protein n=1 Tax=Mycobacterium phage DS6A TaxID=45764 RepID=G8I4G3_9CAUD|nr:hypothetical protein DS6A_53 [Mycobacterium phage DS6A]AER47607.1 hypothetical protein DS6A_53 [Mycobacterium phage DS6A]
MRALGPEARREITRIVLDAYELPHNGPVWLTLIDEWDIEVAERRRVAARAGLGLWERPRAGLTLASFIERDRRLVRDLMPVYVAVSPTPAGPAAIWGQSPVLMMRPGDTAEILTGPEVTIK